MQKKLFLISDTHFFHENIIKACRPKFQQTGLDDMHFHIIEKGNSVVGKNDIVIHMGDVFVGDPEELEEETKKIVKRLNGRKILLLGNGDRDHGKKDRNLYYRIGFEAVESDPIMLEKYIISHEPYPHIDPGQINYHGHLHNSLVAKVYSLDKRRKNMCVENIDYTPVLLCEINE